MKNSLHFIFWLLFISGIFFLLCCNKKEQTNTGILTEEEKSDLLQLREEEKLARDVYLYTYEKYGLSISVNISNSEQTHMDKVLQIMVVYGLADPASNETGVFNNDELQNLYDGLINEVNVSLINALIVGATIEELDIKDIELFLQRTIKEDISSMYESLICGSRNHLRTYYSQIVTDGGTYNPVYISQTEFDFIINSENENCN